MVKVMRESKIETYLKTQAPKHGFLCWKYPATNLKGVPDRLLIGHGQVLFVELKRQNDAIISEIQKLRHKQIKEHGCHVHICASTDDIDNLLSHYPMKKGEK